MVILHICVYLESNEDKTTYEKSVRKLLKIGVIINKRSNMIKEMTEDEVEESNRNMNVKAVEIIEEVKESVVAMENKESGEGIEIVEELHTEAEVNESGEIVDKESIEENTDSYSKQVGLYKEQSNSIRRQLVVCKSSQCKPIESSSLCKCIRSYQTVVALYSPSCNETKIEESIHGEIGTITHVKVTMLGFSQKSVQEWNHLPFILNYQHMEDTRTAMSKQTSKWALVNSMHIEFQVQNKTSAEYPVYDCVASNVIFANHFAHYILMFHILACIHAINNYYLLCSIVCIYYSLKFRSGGFNTYTNNMTLLIINVW